MGSKLSREARRARIAALVETMDDELYAWREQHPEASLDDIVAQVTPRRRRLMGEWVGQLAGQAGNGTAVEGVCCPRCGQPMLYKGDPPRTVEHFEGSTRLQRAYYHCPGCQLGIFPP